MVWFIFIYWKLLLIGVNKFFVGVEYRYIDRRIGG